MCGIFGFVSAVPAPIDHLPRSAGLMKHRGPDGEGLLLLRDLRAVPQLFGGSHSAQQPQSPVSAQFPASLDGTAAVALAHLRLAIVDLSAAGHQPMASERGDLWITFNGEIYNYVEIREELLGLGHRFHSHSDTEVILASYAQWGIECLQRFNGMWAFCIVDRANNRVFFARDRFGVKPLYFWKNRSQIHFASEIKAFLAHPEFSVRPRAGAFERYLREGPAEWERDTFVENVIRLDAASYVYAPLDQAFDPASDQRRWWTLNVNDAQDIYDEGTAAKLAERYYELLQDSVSLRLRADVEVGSALSGGLDSGSVVYLASRLLSSHNNAPSQHSFSSVYQSPGTESCDESGYIAEVAAQCGVIMNTIEPRAEDVPEQHAKVIWHMDTPPDSTCMSGWHTFKLVNRKGIKVTLDGQGADEQLAGYLDYLANRMREGPVGRMALEAVRALAIHPPRSIFGAFGLAIASKAGLDKIAQRLSPRHARIVSHMRGGLNERLATDCRTSLANLIHYADRTSMAFSVESRMPFLDVRLAEFLAEVPSCYKIHNGWTKLLARQAFDRKLPDDIVWRRDKMGWPIPERTWAAGPLKTWFAGPTAQQSRFNDLGVGELFSSCITSDSMTERVRALNLDAWLRTYVDGEWKKFH